MKMADVLRDLADKLDGIEGNSEETSQPNQAELTPVQIDGDNGAEVTSVMVPPLQAKLELLKKATGVDNVYDGGDELDDIKKLTGIKAVIA